MTSVSTPPTILVTLLAIPHIVDKMFGMVEDAEMPADIVEDEVVVDVVGARILGLGMYKSIKGNSKWLTIDFLPCCKESCFTYVQIRMKLDGHCWTRADKGFLDAAAIATVFPTEAFIGNLQIIKYTCSKNL